MDIDEDGKINLDVYFIGEGFVGQEASVAFKDYVEKYSKNVTVEDLLAGRKQNLVKDFKLNDSNAMIDKLAEHKMLTETLDATQVANLAKFCYAIQAELAMKAWEKLTKANDEAVKAMWSIEVDEGKTFGQ